MTELAHDKGRLRLLLIGEAVPEIHAVFIENIVEVFKEQHRHIDRSDCVIDIASRRFGAPPVAVLRMRQDARPVILLLAVQLDRPVDIGKRIEKLHTADLLPCLGRIHSNGAVEASLPEAHETELHKAVLVPCIVACAHGALHGDRLDIVMGCIQARHGGEAHIAQAVAEDLPIVKVLSADPVKHLELIVRIVDIRKEALIRAVARSPRLHHNKRVPCLDKRGAVRHALLDVLGVELLRCRLIAVLGNDRRELSLFFRLDDQQADLCAVIHRNKFRVSIPAGAFDVLSFRRLFRRSCRDRRCRLCRGSGFAYGAAGAQREQHRRTQQRAQPFFH